MRFTNTFSKQFCTVLGALAVLATIPAHAKGGPCTYIPLNFSIEMNDPRGIYSDNDTTYVHGVDGVSALLNLCTNDALLQTTTTKRKIGLDFSKQLSSTPYSPKWTEFAGNVFINVRKLLYPCVPPDGRSDCTFSTRMGVDFTGPDKVGYKFRIQNPTTDAVEEPIPAWTNYPWTEAKVIVHHIPANGSEAEQWEVYPEPASSMDPNGIGTLMVAVKNKMQSAGQYSVPFKIVITRK
jgi:hypothetical protein